MDHNSPSSKAKLPFSLNEMSFIGWIGDLDLDNKEETLSSVSSALKELKQTPIKEELRYLFLQKLGAIVEQLSLQLQESYKNSLFPFSKQDTSNIELSAICAMEIAQNYKVLCESKGFKSKQMFTPKQKSQAVYNGIRSLAKQLLYKSMLYQKPGQGFWELSFLLYLFAKQNDVLELEIDFTQSCFLSVFKQILLFELSNTQQFNTEELLAVFSVLDQFSHHTLLLNKAPEKKFRGLPYINFRTDAPPALLKEDVAQQPYFLYISSLNVMKTLVEQSTNKVLLKQCNKSTLMRLTKALTMNQQRKSERDNVDDGFYALVGFEKVKKLLLAKNKTKSSKKVLAPGEVRDLDFDIEANEIQHINPEEFRTEREANLTISTESHIVEYVENTDIWLSKKERARQKAKKAVANAALVDKSSSGYQLSLKGVTTKVGDIIAVVIADNIEATVVRRIVQRKADEIQVGVEVLGNNVELLHILDRQNKSVPALYLKKENAVESIIIGINDFKNEEYLFVDINDKMDRFRVEKQLNLSSVFIHIKVSPA